MAQQLDDTKCFVCEREHLKQLDYDAGVQACLKRQAIAMSRLKHPYHGYNIPTHACEFGSCIQCPQGQLYGKVKPKAIRRGDGLRQA